MDHHGSYLSAGINVHFEELSNYQKKQPLFFVPQLVLLVDFLSESNLSAHSLSTLQDPPLSLRKIPKDDYWILVICNQIYNLSKWTTLELGW